MAMWRHPQFIRTISFLILISLAALPAQAKYSGGSGTAQDPYSIATAADLIALGETPADYDKHFVLTADIDLDPKLPGRKVFDKAVIAPGFLFSSARYLSYSGTPFAGVLDGNGHTIRHLTARIDQVKTGGTALAGLFGRLGGEVRSLGVADVNITGSGCPVGGLAANNEGTVTECHSSGAVSGTRRVGGLVGDNTGWIVNSYTRGSVSGGSAVGGLVGSNGYIQTYDIHYEVSGEIVHSYSASAVSGASDVGGLVGLQIIGPVISSFWDIQASGQAKSAAGVGETTGQMQDFQTYLDAGWDWVGENQNGTSEIWQMPARGGYPILSFSAGYAPPQLKGLGTPDDPYLISNAMELGAVAHYSSCAHYRLAASLDLSGIRWVTAVVPFLEGSFDGNGHTISHLTIQGGSLLGLFAQVGVGVQVKNLGVVDVNIIGSSNYYVGGLAATNGGTVMGCYSTGAVRNGGSGGLSCIGGLIGSNSGTVTQCHSAATIDGISSAAGGLVGGNGGSLTECYSTGVVSVTGSDVGGLVGANGGSLTKCYSTGPVSATGWDAGGLVGSNGGTVTQCYATGTVSGNYGTGGLVGGHYLSGVLAQCYSTGMVNGTQNVGGLVGWNVGAATQCYSVGAVNGKNNVGGLVVYAFISPVTACFWDTQTSGQTASGGGTGKTTPQMHAANTFLEVGWDFIGETKNGTEDIWWIDEGKDYPRLWWELIPEN